MAVKTSSRKKSARLKFRPVPANCEFCRGKTKPDYKDYQRLGKYVSDRAKILGKDRSGVCTKHQGRLGREIKRARHLGLLPFTPKI